MTTTATDDEVRHQVWLGNRALHRLGMAEGVTSSVGHVSMRLPSDPNRFLIKGREMEVDALAVVKEDEIITCDLDAFIVGGKSGLTQVSEVKIHSCIYKMRPDVVSVVHCHPKFTVLMGDLEVPIVPMCAEGSQIVRRPLPVYPHRTLVHTDEEGTELATVLGSAPAALMRGHGAVTVGRTVSQSVMGMAQLEEQARMNMLAYCAVGKDYDRISDELLDEVTNHPPLWELPHFQNVLKGRAPQRDGTWAYQMKLAERDLW